MFFAFIIYKWYRRGDFECRFFDIHISFNPFDNLSNSYCYRNVTFPVSRRLSFRSLFFSFRRKKLMEQLLQLGFYVPQLKKLWSLLPGNENHKYALFFLILQVSAPPLLLYWPIAFFQTLKSATFSGKLNNPMSDFCLYLSYKALPHWGTQQYIPDPLLVILGGLFWEELK